MDKPVTLIREELVEGIVGLINESKLPMFVLEPILKDIYFEVKNAARQQLENDKMQYQSSLSKLETEDVKVDAEEAEKDSEEA